MEAMLVVDLVSCYFVGGILVDDKTIHETTQNLGLKQSYLQDAISTTLRKRYAAFTTPVNFS
jgi:hypothetical protein